MGQVYSVELKLNIRDRDKEKFLDIGDEFIRNNFFNRYCGEDVFDNIIRTVLAAHQGNYGYNKEEGIYISLFNASYGYEETLALFFEAIKPTLYNGSYIKVYPDNHFWERWV